MITKKKNHGVKRIWGGFPERRAIGEIKNNKAEGIDDIPIEMLKTFGEKAMKELVQLCKEIYNTGVWSEDFLQTVMVLLKKKPNAMTCEDHRTISLLTYASKIVLRVLTKSSQVNFRLMAEYNISVSRLTELHSRFTSNKVLECRLKNAKLKVKQWSFIAYADVLAADEDC